MALTAEDRGRAFFTSIRCAGFAPLRFSFGLLLSLCVSGDKREKGVVFVKPASWPSPLARLVRSEKYFCLLCVPWLAL